MKRILSLSPLAASLALVAGFGITDANARITRIDITSTQSPTFEGKTFGAVGAYEKLRGKAYGEVDPNDPLNDDIVDIGLAPRNANGKVEYSMDIYILKPANLASGNHKLFYEPPNRGGKQFGGFNLSSGGSDPTTAAHAGEGFLMNLGYSMAWGGWDISASSGGTNMGITVPVVKNADGTTITGPSYEYIIFDNATTRSSAITYPANSLDTSQATLTVKEHLNDAPTIVPADGWEYVDPTTIRLLPAGTAFKQSFIYELSYIAKDPVVSGLGLASTRDFVSFLKYATTDDFGNPNPLAGNAQQVYSWTLSQPGRFLNDFRYLGFNEDEQHRIVFDGMENWIGAGTGVAINFRFAQPGRTERNRQNHLYPEGNFPFAFPSTTDPFTSKTDGREVRCKASNTCPKSLEVMSASEYWVKTASLLTTDANGNDLPDPENMRFFLLSSMQHGSGSATSMGSCQQFQNPTDANPALRALWIALDQWVTQGILPPKSDVPRKANGTAVFAVSDPNALMGVVPQAALGWPNIPGVTYNGLITVRHLFDFGPRFDSLGIMDVNPPAYIGRPIYPNFVSKVDVDGNEVAGVRLPPVAAPIATLSGWALRRAGFAENDGCEGSGQSIAFKTTKAERLAAGDPRLSLQERYQTHDGYVKAVSNAAQKLQKQRLLLSADVQKYITAAQNSNVLK